jgi:homoserine kinase
MGKGMADAVIEPARAHLIPGMADVRKGALEAGAAGFAISGAGPSVLALVNARKTNAAKVAEAMRAAFVKHNVRVQTIRARPGPGARIVKREES